MSNIWLTSDLHLGHNKEFLWRPRGFNSIEEHDAAIINNINEAVMPEDTLYLLGDTIMGDQERGREWLQQLNCRHIKYIEGNHETNHKMDIYDSLGFEYCGLATKLVYNKRCIYLSHYPTATTNWNDDTAPYQRVLNVCGHTHQKTIWDEHTGSYHVELDANNNYPVLLDDILLHAKMRQIVDEAERA